MSKDAIGYLGGTILSVQTIPQIWKSIRTGSSTDISYAFLLLNLFGLILMTVYGVLNEDPPVYIPTTLSTLLTNVLLIIKAWHSARAHTPVLP